MAPTASPAAAPAAAYSPDWSVAGRLADPMPRLQELADLREAAETEVVLRLFLRREVLQICDFSSMRPKRPTRPGRKAPSAHARPPRSPSDSRTCCLLLHEVSTACHSLRFFVFLPTHKLGTGWAPARPAGAWSVAGGMVAGGDATSTSAPPARPQLLPAVVASAEGWSERLAHRLRDSRAVAHAQGGGRASAAAPAQPQQQLLQSSD
eukprot:COSAG03_NODE_5173_length_1325_cov_28.999184_2_plen_208_part_00